MAKIRGLKPIKFPEGKIRMANSGKKALCFRTQASPPTDIGLKGQSSYSDSLLTCKWAYLTSILKITGFSDSLVSARYPSYSNSFGCPDFQGCLSKRGAL